MAPPRLGGGGSAATVRGDVGRWRLSISLRGVLGVAAVCVELASVPRGVVGGVVAGASAGTGSVPLAVNTGVALRGLEVLGPMLSVRMQCVSAMCRICRDKQMTRTSGEELLQVCIERRILDNNCKTITLHARCGNVTERTTHCLGL